MPEPTQPSERPRARGPWPDVEDLSRIYDHGRSWCANADAHPDANGGYPDPDRHLPWRECRTLATAIAGVRADLHGAALELEVYAAASFTFGEPRTPNATGHETRVVLEAYADGPGTEAGYSTRLSLSIGDALHLARKLVQIVDVVTVPVLRDSRR